MRTRRAGNVSSSTSISVVSPTHAQRLTDAREPEPEPEPEFEPEPEPETCPQEDGSRITLTRKNLLEHINHFYKTRLYPSLLSAVDITYFMKQATTYCISECKYNCDLT